MNQSRVRQRRAERPPTPGTQRRTNRTSPPGDDGRDLVARKRPLPLRSQALSLRRERHPGKPGTRSRPSDLRRWREASLELARSTPSSVDWDTACESSMSTWRRRATSALVRRAGERGATGDGASFERRPVLRAHATGKRWAMWSPVCDPPRSTVNCNVRRTARYAAALVAVELLRAGRAGSMPARQETSSTRRLPSPATRD